ncbi:hypothetical protein LWI28_013360 [Acer negundo]|uniref:Uncharacterized protein n=1 Tax=Acer negundo TaxID=4023 RepID=A0AAD5NQ60_ACENE|nr:hypothetical protein LWI28_013360 [Acer negundo]
MEGVPINSVNSMLGKIKECGRKLFWWNKRKRSELRQTIIKSKDALREASNHMRPGCRKVINGLEVQMLPFSVSVKNGDKVCDLGIMEVDEFNVISIINDAKKAFEGNFIKEYDNLKLCIIFMWSMQQHLLETDATLLAVLEEYDKRNLDNIEFNIDVIPYASEPPNPNLIGQTPNSNIETQPNTTQSSSVVLVDFDIELDFEYIPDYESNDDSDVSLFDSIVEAEDSMNMDSKRSLHCDPNEMGGHHSSDEENGATRMVRYFVKHEWKPNLDMSISLGEGQVFRNV